MRVHDNGTNPLAGAGVTGPGGAQKAGAAGPVDKRHAVETSPGGDSVQISSLGQALKAAGADSPERRQRVEQLRMEVHSGRYQTDPMELSRKLIDDAAGGGV